MAAANSSSTTLVCHAGLSKASLIERIKGKNIYEVGFLSVDTAFVASSKVLRNPQID